MHGFQVELLWVITSQEPRVVIHIIPGLSQDQNEMLVLSAGISSQIRLLGQFRGSTTDRLRRCLLTIEWQSRPKAHDRPNHDLPIPRPLPLPLPLPQLEVHAFGLSNTSATSAAAIPMCFRIPLLLLVGPALVVHVVG